MVSIQQLGPEDLNLLLEFSASHTLETLYLRFGYARPPLNPSEAHLLLELDRQSADALGALVQGEAGPQLVGLARYAVGEDANYPDVAVVVHEDFRRQGVGNQLLTSLCTSMRRRGFQGVSATVLDENHAALAMVTKLLGPPQTITQEAGQRTLRWSFHLPEAPPGTP